MRLFSLFFSLICLCSGSLAAQSPAGLASDLDPCALPFPYGTAAEAQRLVRAACEEHRLWFRPTIDQNGRLANLRTTEAEQEPLADDGLRAWQRVASYWKDTGLLPGSASNPDAPRCLQPLSRDDTAACRSFLIDTPWSATFISWLMQRAGITGFQANAAHMPYIATAHAGRSVFRATDPYTTRIRPGDLLCHLRGRSTTLGYAGLRSALDRQATSGWQSHCDVVVASNPGGNRTLYAIGGNVLNAVTLRQLPLTEDGSLGLHGQHEQACAPGNLGACNFNHRDWSMLLQLTLPSDNTLVTPSVSP